MAIPSNDATVRRGLSAALGLSGLAFLTFFSSNDGPTDISMSSEQLRALSVSAGTRILERDGNVHSLMRSAWDFLPGEKKTTTAATAPAGTCLQPIWDYTMHGCCPVGAGRPKLHPNLVAFQVSQLFEKWRNHRIVFIGDSITAQVMNALLSNLNAEGKYSAENVKVLGGGTPTMTVTLDQYNLTMYKVGNGGGITTVKEELMPADSYFMTPDLFEKALQLGDVAYVNFGLHMDALSSTQLDATYDYVRAVMEAELVDHPHKRLFYRTTLPQHFVQNDGTGGDYKGAASGECVAPGVETAEHLTSRKATEAFRGSTITVLDASDFLFPRPDLHSPKPGDCSHWCWDHEMWRGLFYQMAVAFD